jgi:hypothetical protein
MAVVLEPLKKAHNCILLLWNLSTKPQSVVLFLFPGCLTNFSIQSKNKGPKRSTQQTPAHLWNNMKQHHNSEKKITLFQDWHWTMTIQQYGCPWWLHSLLINGLHLGASLNHRQKVFNLLICCIPDSKTSLLDVVLRITAKTFWEWG